MKSAWVGVLCIIELKNAGWNVEIQNPSLHNGSQKPHPDPKSTASSVQCESDVDLFFTVNFYLVASWWTRNITWRWRNDWERQWGEKDLICGAVKTGCSIMTKLRRIPPYWFVIFSHNMRRRSSHSVHIRQTLHQQTSFSSPSWNPYWIDDDLSLSRKLKKISWCSYAVFQKRHSRNASKTGRNAGSYV